MVVLSDKEQLAFRSDLDKILLYSLSLIPDDKKEEARNNFDQFYIIWGKLLKPVVKNLNHDEIIRVQKLQKEYIDLKQSVIINNTNVVNNISLDSIANCVEQLQTLSLKMKHSKAETRLIQFQMGEALKKLRSFDLTKKRFQEIAKQAGYHISYAYFLIKLFEACEKYKKLRYTSYSTRKLKNNFSDLLKFMESDIVFWSQ
jgi:hypothetical protein